MFKVIELLNGAFGILYEDCLAPKPFASNDSIMHVFLAKILNRRSGSDSVRPVSSAQVGTLTDVLEVCNVKVRSLVNL